MPPSKDDAKRNRPSGEDKEDRILKKRTLRLGEISSSSSDEEVQETRMEKIDRLFPKWWEDDQHLASCECDFCQLYYGRKPSCDNDSQNVSGSSHPASEPAGDKAGAPAPKTPDEA